MIKKFVAATKGEKLQDFLDELDAMDGTFQWKSQLLTTLFNQNSVDDKQKNGILLKLLRLAVQHQQQETVGLVVEQLDAVQLPLEHKRQFLLEASGMVNDPFTEYQLLAKYLSLLKDKKAGKPQVDKVLQLAIETPQVLLFDTLWKLPAVQLLDTAQKDLLKVFLDGSLSDFQHMLTKQPGLLQKYSLDKEKCLYKIRILTLCSLAQQTRVVAYDEIAKQLQVPQENAEYWVMNAVKAKLICAKMDQLTRKVSIMYPN